MKHIMTGLVALLFVGMLPLVAMATSCGNHAAGGDSKHMAMSHKDHEGHGMDKAGEMQHKGHSMEGHGDMTHEDHGEHKGHDMGKAHDMEGHGGHGGMMPIGEATEGGVKAVAKVMTYSPEKVEMIKATHHVMVYFTDAATGKEITEGKVALKIKSHEGTSKPMMLMLMGSGFGADIAVEKGHYELLVGTKLGDGKKRQFEYELHNN